MQKEYRNKTITRIFGGNAYLGCYFSAGRLRDHLYVVTFFSVHLPLLLSLLTLDDLPTQAPTSYFCAIIEQPHARLLPTPLDAIIPAALIVIGQTLVLASTWLLGITGRFLGDYFGIITDARVEAFPFNVIRGPIYVGSTMCFAGTALWYVSFSHRGDSY